MQGQYVTFASHSARDKALCIGARSRSRAAVFEVVVVVVVVVANWEKGLAGN